MNWCIYWTHDSGPEPVEYGDDLDPDLIPHPDRWATETGARAALDSMAWCVLPWICRTCLKTRNTAAGTGEPAGWTWIDDPKPEYQGAKMLVCGDCKGAT